MINQKKIKFKEKLNILFEIEDKKRLFVLVVFMFTGSLLDCYTFCEISGLIHVGTFKDCDMIGQ